MKSKDILGMVTTDRPTNRVNLEQVCSLNIEQSRLLQKLPKNFCYASFAWSTNSCTVKYGNETENPSQTTRVCDCTTSQPTL